MLSVKQGTANANFKVVSLTRLGIKPESTSPEVDAHTTRPSELLALTTRVENKPGGLHVVLLGKTLNGILLSCSVRQVVSNYCKAG